MSDRPTRRALGAGVTMAVATGITAAVAPLAHVELWVFGADPATVGLPEVAGPYLAVPIALLAGTVVWSFAVPARPDARRGAIAGFYVPIVSILLAVVVAIPGWVLPYLVPSVDATSPVVLSVSLPLFASIPLFWLQVIVLPLAGVLYERSRTNAPRKSPLVLDH